MTKEEREHGIRKNLVEAEFEARVEVKYKGDKFTVARAEWVSPAGKLFSGEGLAVRSYRDKEGKTVKKGLPEEVASGRALVAMLNKIEGKPPMKHAKKVTDYFKG